jgi:hypothetical protein
MKCRFSSLRPTLCENLRKEYAIVEDTDTVAGLAWYPSAQDIVRQWSEHYRYSVDTVACVVAAISPQVEWTRNLVIADDTLAQRMPSIGGVLHVNLRKAERLRDTDYRYDIAERWTLEARMKEQFPTGCKVLNFARNLAGDMSAVTIDTHALQCALRDPLTTVGLRPVVYDIIADCYKTVADEVGIRPAVFQAILWHSWKRQYPRTWKILHRKQWSVMGEY